MANRGNSHDSEVYGIKDLERLGSPKLDKSAKGEAQPSLTISIAKAGG